MAARAIPVVTATGLSVVYEPDASDPIVDIVFIHGLKGHPRKTWTAKGDIKLVEAEAQTASSSSSGGLSSKFKTLFVRNESFNSAASTDSVNERLSVFWPGDLLPTECPEARILVFGYDTAIAKRHAAGVVNRNSIFAHGKDFVNELGRHRPLRRPVIFIAHSLGGIVLKEALVICSTSNRPEFEDVLIQTAGIIFLGTPHRGSSFADIGEIARQAASAVLMDTNPRILDSLSLRNSDLERCQDTFSALWSKYNFEVKTFQEGLPTRLPMLLGRLRAKKIVPDVSSCLGDHRERAETLNGDHRGICRFTSPNDPSFRKVVAELQRILLELKPGPLKRLAWGVSKADSKVDSGDGLPKFSSSLYLEDLKKIEHFKFKEMSLRQLAIGAPADNTCQWLPASAQYQAWSELGDGPTHPRLLQILGKPGSGKSTLMKWMLEMTRHHSGKSGDQDLCIVSHFFHRRGHELEHSEKGMLHSILYQLCTLHQTSVETFNRYTEEDLRLLESSRPTDYVDALKSALDRIMSDKLLAPSQTIIFVDALDECDQASRMGYYLSQLTESARRVDVRLNICISRREYPQITVRNSAMIQMEQHNEKDIRQYVHHRLAVTDLGVNDLLTLEVTIAARSNGIFLWAVLAVEAILKDVENGFNSKYILRRTRDLPEELEHLFQQMLGQMHEDDLETAMGVFYWAVLATDPLRIREWHHILAFLHSKRPSSLKEWRESEHYTETDDQLERQIKSLSQGLIEVRSARDEKHSWREDTGSILAGAGSLDSTTGDSRVVQPIHETVIEFFVSGRANEHLKRPTTYNFAAEGHLFVMDICLDYLAVKELDELAAARERGHTKQGRSLRHRRSATSFMSSASSHSSKSVGFSSVQHDAPSEKLLDGELTEHLDLAQTIPSSPHDEKLTALERLLQSRKPRNESVTTVFSLAEASTASQTLEEYPALASYALNRAFTHARAAHDLGANPRAVVRKLITLDQWKRWYILQEKVNNVETWKELFVDQGLRLWIGLAFGI